MRILCWAAWGLACLLAWAGCVPAAAPAPALPSVPLIAADGAAQDARAIASASKLTAFVFFSTHCHCLDAHEGRLRALAEAYTPRGVRFVMVDSEVASSRELDAQEAKRRGYPFPIVGDHGAKLANAVGAQYATFTVLVDTTGRVLYRGGIDSDKKTLHADAQMFLRDALDDVLAGRRPRIAEGKTLGCALQKD